MTVFLEVFGLLNSSMLIHVQVVVVSSLLGWKIWYSRILTSQTCNRNENWFDKIIVSRVQNCTFLVANATENWMLVNRISRLLANRRVVKFNMLSTNWTQQSHLTLPYCGRSVSTLALIGHFLATRFFHLATDSPLGACRKKLILDPGKLTSLRNQGKN